MAGDTVIRGAQPVEYVEETTFATTEDDASWNWFGIGTSWSVTEGVNSESITYLPEHGASNKLSKRMNLSHSDMYEGEITYHPQDFDLLKFVTGTTGGTTDDPPSIQVGEVDEQNSEYQRLLGGMGEEVSMSVDEDSTWETSASFIFADGEGWSGSDYVGTGSHATEDTSEPFTYSDLSNVQYGGSPLDGAVESLEFSVSNDIAVVKDPDATRGTDIAALVPVDREISVDVTLTYDSMNMASEVRSYNSQDFTFDIGTTSFTIGGVQFPEFPYEFTADDLISDSVSSDPADSITWS